MSFVDCLLPIFPLEYFIYSYPFLHQSVNRLSEILYHLRNLLFSSSYYYLSPSNSAVKFMSTSKIPYSCSGLHVNTNFSPEHTHHVHGFIIWHSSLQPLSFNSKQIVFILNYFMRFCVRASAVLLHLRLKLLQYLYNHSFTSYVLIILLLSWVWCMTAWFFTSTIKFQTYIYFIVIAIFMHFHSSQSYTFLTVNHVLYRHLFLCFYYFSVLILEIISELKTPSTCQ